MRPRRRLSSFFRAERVWRPLSADAVRAGAITSPHGRSSSRAMPAGLIETTSRPPGRPPPGGEQARLSPRRLEARLAEYPTGGEEDEDALRAYREGSRRWRRRRGRGREAEAEAERSASARWRSPPNSERGRADNVADPLRSSRHGGGPFRPVWADPDYAATEQARMEREERGVEEEDEEDEAERRVGQGERRRRRRAGCRSSTVVVVVRKKSTAGAPPRRRLRENPRHRPLAGRE